MSEQETVLVEQRRPGPLRRIGCGLGVVIWFLIVLTPCFCFTLATQGQISLYHANIPDPDAHPMLEVRLVMEIDYRGLSLVSSSIVSEAAGRLCVQTGVRYLLWQGQGDPADFCDCYTRADAEAPWQLAETYAGACS